MTLPPEKIAEMRALLEKATKGEWWPCPTPGNLRIYARHDTSHGRIEGGPVLEATPRREVGEARANQQIAAAAVNNLPALLSSLERAEARVKELPGLCAEHIETLADFFAHGATGPGERTYTVEEIAQMVREWGASLRTAALSPPPEAPVVTEADHA